MYSWSQRQRLRGEGTEDIDKLRSSVKQCTLSLFDQFYLVLQKLRVGTFNQVLADNFKISLPMVSHIFISWINFWYFMLGSFCIWPTREKIRQPAPACCRVHYPRCRGIIDATEIKVQAPSNMVLNSEMYLSCKGHTTYKGNVVIALSAEIIHASALFESSISDKELVKRSGLFPFLEPGVQLMADKGFDIKDILEPPWL